MIQLSASNAKGTYSIELPYSKSLSNRTILIYKLLNYTIDATKVAQCDDTRVMQQRFSQTIDIEGAGTAMRFLTAFLALKGSEHILTGNQRMQERPIAPLVEALQALGADIEYVNQQGYPPLKIKGKPLKGGTLQMDSTLSSQYISAMMLIAPYLDGPLEIRLIGNTVSRSYIEMTAALMRQFGAEVESLSQSISIKNTPYSLLKTQEVQIERDWTAASYVCAWTALQEDVRMQMPGLSFHSLQGDAKAAQLLYEALGIALQENETGVVVHALKKHEQSIHFNMQNYPDIVQTIVVLCCIKGIAFQLEGVDNLRIKESNRLEALKNECAKMGYSLQLSKGSIKWDGTLSKAEKNPILKTYGDHRMAMSLALFSIKQTIGIENPEVVNKSFPDYWKVFNQSFKINKI